MTSSNFEGDVLNIIVYHDCRINRVISFDGTIAKMLGSWDEEKNCSNHELNYLFVQIKMHKSCITCFARFSVYVAQNFLPLAFYDLAKSYSLTQ